MTSEEMERAIDFLLKSQANLEARIEQTNEQLARTDEQQARTSEQLARTDEQLARTDEQLARTDEQLARTDERLRQLTEQVSAFADTQANIMLVMTRTIESQAQFNDSIRTAIGELATRQSRTEESLVRLAEAQAHSDRRLDALIDIVRGGRNGQ
jgi:chromosome segregation ATPase